MTTARSNIFYATTPIYYVNDRPHIGHVYTTTVTDVFARYHRLVGRDTFFLTGTDEHAAKVRDAAAERNLTPQQWADRNAAEFEQTFRRLGMTHDDFIRTSQPRHIERVKQYVKQLIDNGDVYPGEYEGWYDAGQEEYLPENKAKEYDFKSPFNGKPLVRKAEKNYFFKLSKYADAVRNFVKAGGVRPEARANEVLARVNEGLNDVPISRTGSGGWGIPVPGDDTQTIYVWIDALFNYLSTVDTDDRRKYWPADVHFIAKDILWFHAVIWPAMLTALDRPLPRLVYAHSFWIRDGQKMSKSLGNFIDLEQIDHYVNTFGLDAMRYFLASNGPMGTTDADFTDQRFVDVYNTDLANTIGNCFSRITNMTGRYFDGKIPQHGPHVEGSKDYAHIAERCASALSAAMNNWQLDKAAAAALELVREIDQYIEQTKPFKLAKDPATLPQVGTILYNCAEAIRIASLLLWPFLPEKAEQIWQRLGLDYAQQMQASDARGKLNEWTTWGQLQPGVELKAGDPLFPRYTPEKA